MKPLRPNSRELAPWPTVQVGKHVGIMFNGSIPVFQTGRVGSNPIIHSIWGYGEIGRRARFRFLCLNPRCPQRDRPVQKYDFEFIP